MADPRIPTGPIHRDPGGFIPEPQQHAMLLEVLDGVILGTYDHRIIEWLAGWDASTVRTVASLILRARHTEAAQLAADLAGLQKRQQGSTSGEQP
jgi:hypothetical protein